MSATTWPIFHTPLVHRHEVAERTIAFEFTKPAGWTFKAGQFIDMTLVSPPETDAEGDKRGFSIASAPEEPTLMVASRMRDTAFKRDLQKVPLGTTVTIEGPFGSLTLHNNPARAAVILAGGIGITPFRSILIDAAKRSFRSASSSSTRTGGPRTRRSSTSSSRSRRRIRITSWSPP
jgi:ferredoxin-NADP reductase